MAYKYDPLKYKNTFDGMFGAGEFDKGIGRAREIGKSIGEAKLERELRELQRKLEEEKKKEEEEKKKDEKSKKSKENDNLKKRIEASGGSTEKKQSKIGKKLNLDPDNNLFFDTLDLLGRPLNAVMNVGKREEEREKSKSAKDKYLEEMQSKPIWETGLKGKWDVLKDQASSAWEGFSGKEKTTGADVLEEAGMEKGLGRTVAGFGLDVAVDPLNLVGGAAAKVVGAGAGALNKGLRKSDKIGTAMDAVGDVFSNKRIMRETLNPKETTDDLLRINDELHAARSKLSDKSHMDIVKAQRRAGRASGIQVGEKMEEPLSRIKPLDTTSAPNVLDNNRVFDPFKPAYDRATDSLSPLARTTGLETKSTMTSKIGDLPDPTDKEVRSWLKANDLPGADKKGRVSKFNKNLYKAENEQALRQSFQVETKITKAVTNSPDIDTAAKTILKDPALKKNINQAAQTLIDSNSALREFAEKNGITGIGEIEGYMAHFATKEARKYLQDIGEDFSSSGAAKVGGDQRVLGRKIQENVKNANAIMKKKTGVDQFFNPDAFTATAGGQHRVINYIISEMAKKKVIENGNIARPLRAGATARKGYVKMEIEGKAYEMTQGAAKVIQNYDKVINDTTMEKSLRAFDKAMNVWKKSALFSGGYHARNMVGNTFNMAISDMTLPEALAKQTTSMGYLHYLKDFRAGKITDPKKLKVPKNVQKYYTEFVETGLRATGIGADFADATAEKAISEVNYRGASPLGKLFHEPIEAVRGGEGVLNTAGRLLNSPFEQSRRLGDEADEIARFTLYRHLREKGMGPEKATKRVKEVLFDYNDLTTVEREGLKRLAPFYTFTRKNFEFQVKNMLQNPAKYSHMSSLYNAMYDESGQNEDLVPEYLKNGLAIPLGDKSLNFNMPAGDLARTSENPLGMIGDMLTPALKLPLEIGTNRSFFNDAPIEEYDGQKGITGLSKKAEYGLFGAFAPARNIAGGVEMLQEGEPMSKAALKASGSLLTKDYDEENYQLQADYKENERLQGIKKQMEDEGKQVLTFKEMRELGIPTNEEEEAAKEVFDASNLSLEERQYMKELRTKLRRSGDKKREQIIYILEQQGAPPDLINYLTN